MQQAADFVAESETLDAALEAVNGQGWETVTQFKGWTLNDVLVHLHFWNGMVDLALHDPDGFARDSRTVMAAIQTDGFRATENARVSERGPALRAAWRARYLDMGPRWAALDPKARVQWVGPEMSVRSAMTARQMETWAHGQEVFDALGQQRVEQDRIRNIVMLGVNTFGWSFRVHGREMPAQMPQLRLTAPSGAEWRFGEDPENTITGAAFEFAQVVAQTRNVADTGLAVSGPVAAKWMAIAQCFAGGPEIPPAPGQRHLQ
ncbi:TIGR03084 family metal-binding protein [Ruegeria sp. 2012CJ41-6]|uniref:TIGR03084 family metal-binding protein n=1 Tax=Ruegeria spongiae TaxID=2942209 RepID=A0ABT0Q6N7_9RHOB|nr:TIGR03084 family metal-binding protein [Ruegeria spongiae]MCL6285480.1 TIGR03084 family metal-binding protein [Ruegeria spongiae]